MLCIYVGGPALLVATVVRRNASRDTRLSPERPNAQCVEPIQRASRCRSKPGKGRKAAAGNCIPLTPSHRNSKYIFWYWRMNR
jgi:hypothetical protein